MASENHKIDHYQCEVVSEAYGDDSRCLKYLFLYGAHRVLLCALVCVSGNNTFATPEMTPNGHVSGEIGEPQMAALIDLLRNEKPVYFSWNSGAQALRISTNKEPVGEQEMRKMFSFLYI